MIIARCPIQNDQVDLLEEYFFSLEECQWTIFQVRINEPFFLQGYFSSKEDADKAWKDLKAEFSFLPDAFEAEDLPDQDWQNAYKAFLKPWSTRQLHWVPAWQSNEYVLPEGHTQVIVDAGMAFGSGTHETTQLCAERLVDFLKNNPEKDATILDAGCGSGILAISAHVLGFKHIEAFDIDSEAIRVSQENLTLNHLNKDTIPFSVADLSTGLQGKQADLILANILAPILMNHAEELLKALAPKGILVMSGILSKELPEVQDTFSKVAESLWKQSPKIESKALGEWSDLKITCPF